MRICKGNNPQEVGGGKGQTVEIETIQEITTRIEIEIEGTVETTPTTSRIIVEMTVEIEIDIKIGLIQEMEKIEENSKDLEQVKDNLANMNSVTTVIKQVIQHIGASN